ncbi:GNAT family N-acetyltransferase [uncultured Pseudokineococcus sp.]|uniref:GNAT family N-acetyltransferase n=1 Tax=uncultured Pseudokineococcus sp. TaxID=1642928 RepID=UPI002633BD24|nr:GNAT family N-acetyltransferase [uncultured Pseudokineococcus sp.]
MVVVRERTDGDVGAAAGVLAGVHAADGYPSRWPADPEGWLRPDGARGAWVAVEGAALLGHVLLVDRAPGRGLPTDAALEVVRLFVDPAARGRGLAAALLAAALGRAEELGLDVDLQVVAASPAVRAYERLGWRAVRRHLASWTEADGTRPEVVRMAPPVASASSGAARVGGAA